MKKRISSLAVIAVFNLAAFNAVAQEAESEEEKSWQANAELGMIFTSGNTETTTIKGKLDLVHDTDNWSNQFIIDGFLKEDEIEVQDEMNPDVVRKVTQETANKYFLSYQANYKLSKEHDSLFGYVSYEDDEFGAYDEYTTLSAGYGTRLIDKESVFLDTDIGPGYVIGKRDGFEDQENGIVRATLDFTWEISDNATFTQFVSVDAGFESDSNVQTKSLTALSAKINGALQMKLGLTVTNNSEVDADKEKTDTETFVTLVYAF